jgi:hypothetical protein
MEYDWTAANFMQFYVARGSSGLRTWIRAHEGDRSRALAELEEILSAGPRQARQLLARGSPQAEGDLKTPQDWWRFLFPERARPVYLLLDKVFLEAFASWWATATWDLGSGEGRLPLFRPFFGLELDLSREADWKEAVREASARSSGARLDPYLGVLRWGGSQAVLDRLILFTGERMYMERYNRPEDGYRFEAHVGNGLAALMDERVAASVFNRLFLREAPSRYFVPVERRSPEYQLWEVRSDPVPSIP